MMDTTSYINPTHRHWLLKAFSCLPLEEVRKLPTVCSTWAKWIREDKTLRHFDDRRVSSFQNLSLRGALRLASFVSKVDSESCIAHCMEKCWGHTQIWLEEAGIQPDTLKDLRDRLDDGQELEWISGPRVRAEWWQDDPPRTAFFSECFLRNESLEGDAIINSFSQFLARGTRAEAYMLALAAAHHDWSSLDDLLAQGVPPNVTNASGFSSLSDPRVLADVDACRGLLDRGVDVNGTGGRLERPLQSAARLQHELTVELLLQRGADPTLTGAGRTPLHEAASYGNIAIATLLLEAGAPIDAQDSRGQTPLHCAHKFPQLCRLLLERGADPNLLDAIGRSCLSRAVEHNAHETIALFLNHPHDPPLDLELADRSGRTALWFAVEAKQIQSATALLKAGASCAVTSSWGTSLTHRASSQEMLALLLNHGASMKGCLNSAVMAGNLEQVNLLLERGANPKGDDSRNIPILKSAPHPAAFQRLLDAGADLAAVDEDGYGFLHYAAMSGLEDFSPVDTALARGLNINERDATGLSPLGWAFSAMRSTNYWAYWLDRGANINAQDNEGSPILHRALIDCREYSAVQKGVAFLLEKGADVHLADKEGRSAMTFALSLTKLLRRACALMDRERCRLLDVPDCDDTFSYERKFSIPYTLADRLLKESLTLGRFQQDKFAVALQTAQQELWAHRRALVTLLLQHGAAVDAPDHKGFHPLHHAAMEGDLLLAQLLLDSEASADGLDARGRSPLHWAAIRGHLALVKLLLTRGAKQDLMDSEGSLPSQLAATANYKSIAKLLSAKS